ncbi:MAG: hypothetical protein IT307_16410 [Chloroflexi bacterium]|nr:hypothetical protein [Chloroflexota bacterium]
MYRALRRTATLALGLALALSTTVVAPAAWAQDDDNASPGEDQSNPDFGDSTVAGRVYHVNNAADGMTLEILDLSLGIVIDVHVKDPGLLSLIKNNTVCVGRFVTAEGIRVSDSFLEAQGLKADMTTGCGELPD